jgi:hypothetical protein
MNPQEQEEADFRIGAASDLQNAYSLSCLDRKPDDKQKIDELVSKGRFCVVAWNVEFCRHTDAILPGRALHLVADFPSKEAAQVRLDEEYEQFGEYCDGESGFQMFCPPVPPSVETPAEVPF